MDMTISTIYINQLKQKSVSNIQTTLATGIYWHLLIDTVLHEYIHVHCTHCIPLPKQPDILRKPAKKFRFAHFDFVSRSKKENLLSLQSDSHAHAVNSLTMTK